ncbi:MAG: hypothetical protein AB7S38_00270 [Vulcanimicrobiota bacterium]
MDELRANLYHVARCLCSTDFDQEALSVSVEADQLAHELLASESCPSTLETLTWARELLVEGQQLVFEALADNGCGTQARCVLQEAAWLLLAALL